MSKVTPMFERKADPDFCERQLKRVHLDILEAVDGRGLSNGGVDCSFFEFYGDGRTQQEAIIAVVDGMNESGYININVPQYLRDYVVETYGKSHGADFECSI